MRTAAVVAGGALLAAVLAARRCYVVVTVGGPSMRPAFTGGERVLARRCPQAIDRGAVVVAEVPNLGAGWGWHEPPGGKLTGRHWMVKRVIAVAGDPTPERCAAAAGVPAGTAVPHGQVLLAGDNTGASLDSHVFGFVPCSRVLGTVVRILGTPGGPGLPASLTRPPAGR